LPPTPPHGRFAGTSRRDILGAAVGGLVAAALPATLRLPSATAAAQALAGSWALRWAPAPASVGLGAFESIEDDRADSHTAGQPHIYPVDDTFRFNMHMADRDTSTDRQRQEVTGMRTSGSSYLSWLPGETWRTTYQMYIPSSLKATTSFTHIMQTKRPGAGTSPITVMSLRRVNGVQTIELKLFEANILVGRTDLAPLHNSWVDVDFQLKIGDGTAGSVRWILRKDGVMLVDGTKTGVDTSLGDRVRPKWGIYRSLGDTSGSLQDCHLLLRNMRGYQLVDGPAATDHQAENAFISQGLVESNHAGYSGTGFVNYDNVTGSFVEWSVPASTAGQATVALRYANGTTLNRPMNITVNGTVVSAGHAFTPTGGWASWATTTLTVQLSAGTNKIRATATTANGGPNVDKITVG
jgi:hypothetical protein